uniref:Uncharacterized protein n=1 Tax=Romanomermis culicivorax TaxID=13658 RepID=A0A915JF46_ROMCU
MLRMLTEPTVCQEVGYTPVAIGQGWNCPDTRPWKLLANCAAARISALKRGCQFCVNCVY